MSIHLTALAASLDVLEVRGTTSVDVSGIAYDSRKVVRNGLFAAFPGAHTDGHSHIDSAISRGATVILHERPLEHYLEGVTYLRVKDARTALSPLSAEFHDHPSRSLCVIGVTGTEGKSTTVYLIYQLLTLAGCRAGFFSTVMSDTGTGEKPNPEHQTTPEAPAVHRMLAEMRDAGCEYAIVEASSHGLSPITGRLLDVAFDVAVLTNVTHEHLEFHGTWENYRRDKSRLFEKLGTLSHDKSILGIPTSRTPFGVANQDDPNAGFFASVTDATVLTYSARGQPATLRASEIVSDAFGSDFIITGSVGSLLSPSGKQEALFRRAAAQSARINLPGEFNVGNALAALEVVAACTGKPWTQIAGLLPLLKPVRGRMTRIDQGQPFEVIVDYAHTPSSFATLFPPLRARVHGRIFCLFGSGGERDRAKRPLQGKIAADYCDVVILCDEDPRGEVPMDILEEIASGCPLLVREERLFLIPDRTQAIRLAFAKAKPGDAVLLLGKGHENSIIYAEKTIPYDEIHEAEKALAELGYRGPGTLRTTTKETQ